MTSRNGRKFVPEVNHLAVANELFAAERYQECNLQLLEALPDAEANENWLLCSAILAQIGHCASRLASYSLANLSFIRAAEMLNKCKSASADDRKLLSGWAADASANEVSRQQVFDLQARVNKLIKEENIDAADDLCECELERGVRYVGERNWYVAMIMCLQARCNLERIQVGVQQIGPAFKDTGEELFADAQQLYRKAIDILEHKVFHEIGGEAHEHPEWFARASALLKDTAKYREILDKGALEVSDEADEAFLPNEDWTPEGPIGEESEAVQQSSGRVYLRSYAQPFSGVNLGLTPEVADQLKYADELFIRREYAQCLQHLDGLIDGLAQQRTIVCGLALTLSARCARALGDYNRAIRLTNYAVDALSLLGTEDGNKMAGQLTVMLENMEEDALVQHRLRRVIAPKLTGIDAENGDADKAFADTVDLSEAQKMCEAQLAQLKSQEMDGHWLYAGVQILKAAVLTERAAKLTVEDQRLAVLDSVDELLAQATRLIDSFGDDAAWVKLGYLESVLEVAENLRG